MWQVKAGTPSLLIRKPIDLTPSSPIGRKTLILPYALNDLIDKFDLPADIFDKD